MLKWIKRILGHRTLNFLRKVKYKLDRPTRHGDLKYITELYNKDIQVKLLEAMIPDGFSFIDIGANLGLYSYWMAKKNQFEIHSFEPRSDIFDRLNATLEGLNNVSTYQIAISNTKGQAELARPTSHGNSSLVKFDHFKGVNYELVQKTSLDEWILKNNVSNIFCIKIDVEGHEYEVINGSEKLLGNNRPKVLLVEIENRHLVPQGRSTEEIINYIKGFGYNCYIIENQIKLKSDSEITIPKDRSDSPYYYNYWFLDKDDPKLYELIVDSIKKCE